MRNKIKLALVGLGRIAQRHIDAINKFKDIDRQEIQDMTWEKYTEKRWKSILDNAIDKTIENFKPHKKGVLPI